MRVGLSSKWKPQKGQHSPMRMRCSWNEDVTSQNSPAHAPHNETRNSCSHCADIPVLVPWFINTTAMKGNILCRPLGWQERGIKMHRRCNANSWSHVGEQNALRIRLQGKKGPPASETRWYSWVANPGSHQNPWHHQQPCNSEDTVWSHEQAWNTSQRCSCLSDGCRLRVSCFRPRRKEGKVEERQSRVQKIICESMKSFGSNFRADLKTSLLLSPCVAPLSATFRHFPAKMILMVQRVAEGTVTFHADACQIRAAHQLWLSSLVTKCPWIYF